jgi:predicted nucleic acid-binding protein
MICSALKVQESPPRHYYPACRTSVPSGRAPRLLDAWERRSFTLVARDALIAELRDVASRPFFRARLRASASELLAAGLWDFSFFCRDLSSGPDPPDFAPDSAPDHKNSYLLTLAEANHAEFLLTGDRELIA